MRSCQTNLCWNTIGLKVDSIYGGRNEIIGNAFSSTLHANSVAKFDNGRFLSKSLLTASPQYGGCGASFGPQTFNAAGTITYKIITPKIINGLLVYKQYVLSPSKTWAECGVEESEGMTRLYAIWTPNRCARRKGFRTTRSEMVRILIY